MKRKRNARCREGDSVGHSFPFVVSDALLAVHVMPIVVPIVTVMVMPRMMMIIIVGMIMVVRFDNDTLCHDEYEH